MSSIPTNCHDQTSPPISDIISHLKDSSRADLFEIRSVSTLRAYTGENEHPVIIEIEDYGDANPTMRYRCVVKTESGKVWATGNPAESIEMAIMIVHWQDLEGDPPE